MFLGFNFFYKADLEGKDKDNPLVVAGVRGVVGAVEPSASLVELVHDAFHVSLGELVIAEGTTHFNNIKRHIFISLYKLPKVDHDLDLLNLILRRYVGASMDPTIILRQVGADPLELAAGEGNILARVESNISLEQYSINVVQKTNNYSLLSPYHVC